MGIWVKELDWKFVAQDRKITLIVDNCPAHPIVDGLKAIELTFEPPNTTSKTEPLGNGGRSPIKVNMLEAMTLLTATWEWVSPITLVNCFRKVNISSESQAQNQSDDDDLFKLLAAQLEEFYSWWLCRCRWRCCLFQKYIWQILKSSLELLKHSLMQQNMIMRMREVSQPRRDQDQAKIL